MTTNIKPNFIDRVVSAISPTAGANRLRARYQYEALSGSFTGASRTSGAMKNWMVADGSADASSLYDIETLRERSSDLIRNSPVASAAINVSATSVIGSGLKLQSTVDYERAGISKEDAKIWERDAEFLFKQWASSVECDSTRTQTFYQMQDLVFRSVFERGDVFALLPMFKRTGSPFGLKVQLLEADRVSNEGGRANTARMAGGVVKDKFGAPTHYYIMDSHPREIGSHSRSWKKVRAFGATTGRRNVLHIYRKLRPNQSRGIPALAPVIEALKQLSRYTEAELMAAVISGMFTVAIESPQEELNGYGASEPNTAANEVKMGNGAMFRLNAGEKVTTLNPARPNAQFDPFCQSILQQIGMSLEIPYEILVKHFSASYSASQAALLEGWRFFNARRDWIADAFCRPVYESFIGEMIAAGRLPARGFFDDPFVKAAYLGSSWIGRPAGHIREDMSIKAAKLRLDAGLSTRQRETALINGEDWENVYEQKRHEDKIVAEHDNELEHERIESEQDALLDPLDNMEDDTDTEVENETN